MTSTISTDPGVTPPADLESARSAGRQLARDLGAASASSGPAAVETMVKAGLGRLATFGIRAEVVRSRPNCVVVRSATRPGAPAEYGCALITSWLESLPRMAHRSHGTVVESSCVTRGAHTCIHTLLWQLPTEPARGAGGRSVAPDPVAPGVPTLSPTVGHPPTVTSDRPAPGGSTIPGASVTTSTAAWRPGDPAAAAAHHSPADRRTAPAGTSKPPVERRRPTTDLTPFVDSWVGRANTAFRPLVTDRRRPAVAADPSTGDGDNAPDVAPTDGRRDTATAGREDDTLQQLHDRTAPEPAAGPVVDEAPSGATVHLAALDVTAPAGRHLPAERSLAAGLAVTHGRGRRRGQRWAWFRRRAWMLALGMVAGAAGGYYAGAHHTTAYSATSVLVIQSGASATGPGSANDAEALAITDAALLPSDQSVLDQVATELHVSTAAVSHDLVAEAISGTALMQVRFTGSTPAAAVAGANDVAQAVSAVRVDDEAIANGSVATVSRAKAASRSGSLYKDALPLGAVLGLLLGAGAALAAERADRRVDEAQALSEATGCPVTVVPGGISPTEMARALDRAAAGCPVTLVPLRESQWAAADQLANELVGAWPMDDGDGAGGVAVTPAFADAPDAVGDRTGPTVLVVGAGERVRAVNEVAARLRLLDRTPVWSVLVAAG